MSKYHAVFRVTTESSNKDSRRLGDRDLACFLGAGDYIFATYYYDDLLENGNANSVKTIPHEGVN